MRSKFWRIDGLQEIIQKEVEKFALRDEAENKITVLIVRPGKEPTIATIGADEGSIYSVLEGPAEGRTLYGTGAEIIYNTFGKTLGLPACRALLNSKGDADDVIAGTFIIAGVSKDEKYISLTKDQIKTFCDLFGDPLCSWRYSLDFSEEY